MIDGITFVAVVAAAIEVTKFFFVDDDGNDDWSLKLRLNSEVVEGLVQVYKDGVVKLAIVVVEEIMGVLGRHGLCGIISGLQGLI